MSRASQSATLMPITTTTTIEPASVVLVFKITNKQRFHEMLTTHTHNEGGLCKVYIVLDMSVWQIFDIIIYIIFHLVF